MTTPVGDTDVYVAKLAADSLPDVPFKRGHTNTDGNLNIADAICLLTYLFGPEGEPCKEMVGQCLDAADTNDDGRVNIADGIAILGHIFADAGPLPEPFTACGHDETEDELNCIEFAGCP